MKAILVMLSNYFHDLAVGILFSSMLLTWYVHRASETLDDKAGTRILLLKIVQSMRKVALAAWFWIIVGGVIRTINYYEYEWLPAAGRGQVSALIVKHVLLATIAVAGSVIQYRLNRLYLTATRKEIDPCP